jgi:hypothetical protein
MRISLILFVFLFLTNCFSINNIETTVEDLKKEGSVFLKKKKVAVFEEDISLISKIVSKNLKEKNFFLNNGINLTVEDKINIFKKDRNNPYKKNILVTKKNIFFIDDKANFFILTHDLKILKKISIYKKKKN